MKKDKTPSQSEIQPSASQPQPTSSENLEEKKPIDLQNFEEQLI